MSTLNYLVTIIVCLDLFIGSVGFRINCLSNRKGCLHAERNRRSFNPQYSTIYLNGTVYTVNVYDRPNDWHLHPEQAIVIEDEYIAFVGSDEDAMLYKIDGLTEIFDLNGKTVLPGFHDIHMHPLEAMSPVGGACLLPTLTRPDDQSFADVFSMCQTHRIGTEWILGAGHSIAEMLDYAYEGNSPKELLDQYVADRPAAMLEETSHSAWVNSKALELANITSSTMERPGGVIMREPNSNEPNGILFENEAIDIFQLAMDPNTYPNVPNLEYDGVLDALDELSRNGITSFCDARVLWNTDQHKVWSSVCNDGYLTARTVLGLWAYPSLDDDYQLDQLFNLYSEGNSNCELKRTQIKLYMDGLVQSTTASMIDAYFVNLSLPIISVENKGMNYFDKARLEKYLIQLQDFGNGKGFDFNIHAIGELGIRDALDAIEAASSSATSRTPRHRITHVEMLHSDDVSRFMTLDVIADFQVAGTFTLPDAYAELAEFVGIEKAQFMIPVKSVFDTGATTTFSSDWDVSDMNPFIGIQHATQRGDQSVDVKTAIEMYTVNPAFAMRQDWNVGALIQDMDADFVIIDQDVFNVAHDKISTIQILETHFKGEPIYLREEDPTYGSTTVSSTEDTAIESTTVAGSSTENPSTESTTTVMSTEESAIVSTTEEAAIVSTTEETAIVSTTEETATVSTTEETTVVSRTEERAIVSTTEETAIEATTKGQSEIEESNNDRDGASSLEHKLCILVLVLIYCAK